MTTSKGVAPDGSSYDASLAAFIRDHTQPPAAVGFFGAWAQYVSLKEDFDGLWRRRIKQGYQ